MHGTEINVIKFPLILGNLNVQEACL